MPSSVLLTIASSAPATIAASRAASSASRARRGSSPSGGPAGSVSFGTGEKYRPRPWPSRLPGKKLRERRGTLAAPARHEARVRRENRCPPSVTSGTRIGAYEIVDLLGAGGMGEVYRARDTRLGRTVALKVLRAGADPELLHRLQREARAASALNHPNIVHIYDVGDAEGLPGAHYVVMEHVLGETLRRHLAPGPLPMAELARPRRAGRRRPGHGAPGRHRPPGPQAREPDGDARRRAQDPRLRPGQADGAARERRPARDALAARDGGGAAARARSSTCRPSRRTGGAVDYRTDQFALGLILHEMATGRPPFRRDTPAQVLAAVIERDPEPLRRLRADVPPALDALVSRCLQQGSRTRATRAPTSSRPSWPPWPAGRGGRSGVAAARRLAITAEVVPPLPAVARPGGPSATTCRARRQGEGSCDEQRAHRPHPRRQALRRSSWCAASDEESWQPLFESRIYRLEVPNAGDPRDAARRRALRGAGRPLHRLHHDRAHHVRDPGPLPVLARRSGGPSCSRRRSAACPRPWSLLQRRDPAGRPARPLPAGRGRRRSRPPAPPPADAADRAGGGARARAPRSSGAGRTRRG